MNPADYDVVFNMAREPYRGGIALLVPGVMAASFLVVAIAAKRTSGKVLPSLGLVAVVAFSCLVLTSTRQQYDRLQQSFRSGRVSIVEGLVESYGVEVRKCTDEFRIGARMFELNQCQSSAAFHQTVVEGGVNLKGRCVRMFLTDRDEIVWLGIRRNACEPMELMQPSYGKAAIGQWDP